MYTELRYPGMASVMRCYLNTGDSFSAQAGSLYAYAGAIHTESSMKDGFVNAVKRSVIRGDSFFITRFTASGPGWVDIVPPLPSEIFSFDLKEGTALFLAQSTWLAHDDSVVMDSKWNGFRNIFNGENAGFLARMSGHGTILGSAYGALDVFELGENEMIVLDNDHLVGYEESISVTTHKISKGWFNTFKTGEGFVVHAKGPGKIFTQTRNARELVNYVGARIVHPEVAGSSGAMIGSAIGNMMKR